MHQRRLPRDAAVLCALAALTAPHTHTHTVHAAISAGFLDEAAWTNALNGHPVVNETLDDFTPQTLADRALGPTRATIATPKLALTFNALNGATHHGNQAHIAAGSDPYHIDTTTHLDITLAADFNNTPSPALPAFLAITFPEPVQAFAADFNAPGDGASIAIWSDDQTFSLQPIANEIGFAGVTFPQPVSEIQILWQGQLIGPALERFGIDNLRYATALPTPGTTACLFAAAAVATRRANRG